MKGNVRLSEFYYTERFLQSINEAGIYKDLEVRLALRAQGVKIELPELEEKPVISVASSSKLQQNSLFSDKAINTTIVDKVETGWRCIIM